MYSQRVEFGGEFIDYKSNFDQVRTYHPVVHRTINRLKALGVEHCWYFYEPYVEITWVSEKDHIDDVVRQLDLLGITNVRVFRDGDFLDWYYEFHSEKEFSWKRYAALTDVSLLFCDYKEPIERGKGLDLHYVRCAHVLANQLGLNYKREGWLLIKRGVLCLLFWHLGHKRAVWVWTKLLRQKY